jgi:hypothetical protein
VQRYQRTDQAMGTLYLFLQELEDRLCPTNGDQNQLPTVATEYCQILKSHEDSEEHEEVRVEDWRKLLQTQ